VGIHGEVRCPEAEEHHDGGGLLPHPGKREEPPVRLLRLKLPEAIQRNLPALVLDLSQDLLDPLCPLAVEPRPFNRPLYLVLGGGEDRVPCGESPHQGLKGTVPVEIGGVLGKNGAYEQREEILAGSPPNWTEMAAESGRHFLHLRVKVHVGSLEEVSEMGKDPREAAREIIDAAIDAVRPEECIRRVFRLEGEVLCVGDARFDLRGVKRIYVVGFGKASAGMARAVEEILGARVAKGVVITAEGYRIPTERIRVHEAGHPLPDRRGLAASCELLSLVAEAEREDLVIVLISGGGSALLPAPAEGITLEDLVVTNELLLRSGAVIQEINAVRKHLSRAKGGQLARLAQPARVVALILSDVVGDPLDSIASGPTVPDPTTFADAVEVLRRYGIWGQVPPSVRRHLERGAAGEIPETPKPGDPCFARVLNLIVGSGRHAAEAALKKGEELGFRGFILTTTLEGEAREVGRVVAAVARELRRCERPISPPALLVLAGETTVTVKGRGKGGRNQELALSAALGIEGLRDVVVASVGTDGRDGPTDAAGGIVDGGTTGRIRAAGHDPRASLSDNDSYRALAAAGDLLVTGPTGTNVADLVLVLAA